MMLSSEQTAGMVLGLSAGGYRAVGESNKCKKRKSSVSYKGLRFCLLPGRAPTLLCPA